MFSWLISLRRNTTKVLHMSLRSNEDHCFLLIDSVQGKRDSIQLMFSVVNIKLTLLTSYDATQRVLASHTLLV